MTRRTIIFGKDNAYFFLLRMALLLIVIHNGGIRKGTVQPRLKLKMVLIFLVTKVFKRTMFKWAKCF